MDNQYGKKSILNVTFCYKDGKNLIEDALFTAPFKVMHPFYGPGGRIELMLVSVSAGIMAGDRQEITITAGPHTDVKVSSQAFEKIHRMESGYGARNTRIMVGSGASLCYAPLPVIPFKGSAFRCKTRVDLTDESSRFVFCEILTGGRKAGGELFSYHYYHSLTDIYRGNKLIYRDNTRYEPDKWDMEQLGVMEGHSHCLNLVAFSPRLDENLPGRLRELLKSCPELTAGYSFLEDRGINIKILGNNSQDLLQVYQAIDSCL